MTHFRFDTRKLAGLSLGLLVMHASPIAFGQAIPEAEFKREGVTSYIFSPVGITVLLVLALVAQLVYRKYIRPSNRKAHVTASPHTAQTGPTTKKRYDREEMSKLLKASATTKGNPRALEEAIRLSQLTQPVLPERGEHVQSHGADAIEVARHESGVLGLYADIEVEVVAEVEGVSAAKDDASTVEDEPQSD